MWVHFLCVFACYWLVHLVFLWHTHVLQIILYTIITYLCRHKCSFSVLCLLWCCFCLFIAQNLNSVSYTAVHNNNCVGDTTSRLIECTALQSQMHLSIVTNLKLWRSSHSRSAVLNNKLTTETKYKRLLHHDPMLGCGWGLLWGLSDGLTGCLPSSMLSWVQQQMNLK